MELNLPTILIVLVLFVAHGYQLWWASYWRKKGDNLATKEDIAALTTITEKIKGEINVLAQHQIGLNADTKAAIINFNDTLTAVMDNCSLDILRKSHEQIVEQLLNHDVSRYSVAESRLLLFLPDDRVEKLSMKIKRILLTIIQINIESSLALKPYLIQPVNSLILTQKVSEYNHKVRGHLEPLHQLRKEMQELMRAILKIN